MRMPLVLPLVPGQRTTPKAVVVEEVRRYLVVGRRFVFTTKQSHRLFRVRRVAKGFELVVVDDTYARDPVTAVRTRGGGNEV